MKSRIRQYSNFLPMQKLFAIFILVIVFVLGYGLAQKFLGGISPSIITNNIVQKTGCDDECRKQIQEEVQRVIAQTKPTPSPKPAATAVPASVSQNHTQFISLDNTFATMNTDWVDVPGTDVTFDIARDYSRGAGVLWQASLKVADSNGQAFARLFDTTHGIGVSGSEISTTNNYEYRTAYSGNLNLWSGNINYRVQIKSLNSFEVGYTGGKIKIQY